MISLPIIQALVGAVSDGFLAGLIFTYVLLAFRKERTLAHSGMIMLLLVFSLLSIIQMALLLSLHSPTALLLGCSGRLCLALALFQSAASAQRTLNGIRVSATNDFTMKLDKELAERRKIERELAHLASFSENDVNPIIEMLPTGELRYRNPAAHLVFGDLSVLGKNHPLFDGIDAILPLIKKDTQKPWTRTLSIGDRIFRQHICLSAAGPGIRLYMNDITDLARLNSVQQALLQQIPSEWLTPLDQTQKALRLLEEELSIRPIDNQRHILQDIGNQLNGLTLLAHRWLDQAPAGPSRGIVRQRADAADLLRQAIASVQLLAHQKALTVALRVEPAMLDIFVDREKFKTAMIQQLQKTVDLAEQGTAIDVTFQSASGQLRGEILITLSNVEATQRLDPICKEILDAHSGRWKDDQRDHRYQQTITIPILTTDDFFMERVRAMHEEAVTHRKSLSLLRLQVPAESAIRQALGDEQTAVLFKHLHQQVSQTLRARSDLAIQSRQCIWIALPKTRREDAVMIAARLQKALTDYATQNASSLPASFDVTVASFPDDSKTVESLLQTIEWFPPTSTDAAPALAPTIKRQAA